MAERNNLYSIKGVIYAKPVRTAEGRKGTKTEGQTFTFPSIILEVKRSYNDKEYIELPEFELGKGLNLEDFAVGDRVEITFALGGKKISDTFHKTVAKALYIKHTDIERDDTRAVGAEFVPPKRESVFVPPNPMDEEEDDQLPF
jgi:hypothetical protein